jgi:predicted PurR-regulated permease PerM
MTNKDHPFSWQALGRIVVVGLGLFIAWRAVSVLVAILIALMIATAVYPLVKKLAAHMRIMPAAILVFTAILTPFILFGVFITPKLVSQIPSLIDALHAILGRAEFLPEAWRTFDAVGYFTTHGMDFLTSTKTVFAGFIAVITVFFLAFYFVLDNKRFLGFFLDLFPEGERDRFKGTLLEVARLNGLYIRGNVVVSLICGLFLFIVLAILGVPFALPLAIFAAILDLLPLVGSTLGSLPAIVIAYAVSPVTGFIVLVLHLFYQQLENVVISPAIYNKALDISPALIFLSVVVGGGLFGILGAFLALPVAASLPAMIRYFQYYRK